ncbi:GTP-binding protein [Mycolicibacterium sp. S2-37]|uniref:ribosome hibernation factor-recruiting GTPase MRF n=1 Tax=Mycolicibacterium sp. S2-37 TaxID=2810297 RepID=UPI001A94256A|nr:GTP-binding protein [Mycolicibacterium sp. S2-37]MBO0680804.1 GTP-binding protein [Mycolicibacterium sp. S2-37]
MRTPAVVVAGQGQSNGVGDVLLRTPGTAVVSHRFDGQVVVRGVSMFRDGQVHVSEWPLELANGCVGCTTRNDLLVLLRRLHRREDIRRIVIHLAPWLEPEPVCWAIDNIDVHVGPDYIDGPASRDVNIEAVVTTVDSAVWLPQALGDDDLDDNRTVAQVVVGQAEFADVLVLTEPDRRTLAVLRRLSPRSRITVGTDRLETVLANVDAGSRRGREHNPHDPLLDGEPPLRPDGDVGLVEFNADRPFHPHRLHTAIDDLLDGVVRLRGRAWLASQPDAVVWIESAGGGLHVGHAGQWLDAMPARQRVYAAPERIARAALQWDERFGDRHIALTVLVCGADPDAITRALYAALLTDEEMNRPQDWTTYNDPFGDWHEDPCGELDRVDDVTTRQRREGDQR